MRQQRRRTVAETELTQLQNGLTCALPANSPLARLLRSQRTWIGPDAKARQRLLSRAKVVAIVGMSDKAARASYFVGTYLLQSSNYRVYFVNPVIAGTKEVLGQQVYPDLASLPETPDIVDVFRKGSDLPGVFDEVAAVGAPAVWVQLGIWNQEAAEYGESLGLTVVMDRCIKVEHARFNGGLYLLGFDTGVISSHKNARSTSAAH
ncbi:MAG: CoA-binding protein [Agromyces sp.]